MDCKLFSFFILVAFSGLSWTSANPVGGDDGTSNVDSAVLKEWKELKDLIYESEQVLKPEETLKYFKRMFDIFPQIKPSMDASSANDWEGRREIVEMGEISQDKCTSLKLLEIDTTFAAYGKNKSVEKLLNYLKGKQYAACKAKFEKDLLEVLKGLQNEQREDVVELANEVLKHNKRYGESDDEMPKIAPQGLAKGSLGFLKQQNPRLSKKTSKKEFKKLYDGSILVSCKTIIDQFKAPIEFVEELLDTDEEEIDREIDQVISDWLIRNQICKRLVEDRENLFDLAYTTLRNNFKL